MTTAPTPVLVPAPSEVDVEIAGSALGAHPGAEAVGVVRATGESATHLLGRAVLLPRVLPCGECEPCRRGRIAVCAARTARPGAPVPRERVPARFVLPLEPPYVPAELTEEAVRATLWQYAALADALLQPFAALLRAGQGAGGLCTVLGGGSRAAMAVVVARALGCQAVVLCPDAAQRAQLLEPPYAALAALDPLALDPDAARARLRELASGAGLLPHGLTLIETSGSDAGRARALAMLEAGGTAILLDRAAPLAAGTPAAPATPPLAAPLPAGPHLGIAALERVVDEQCQILGAGPAHPDLLPELLALLERARIDLSALTRPVEPADVHTVMDARRAATDPAPLLLPIVRY